MKLITPALTAVILFPCMVQAQKSNPFKSIGKKAEVHTLSNGRYQETFDDDVLQRVGTVIIDRRTKKIVHMLDADSLNNEVSDNSTASRWYSVDPLAEKYYSISPYAFCANNPIIYKDANGAYIEGTDGKPVFFDNNNGKITWSANASIDVQRVGNAMLKTKTGREVFKAMQGTEHAISMMLDFHSFTSGTMAETSQTWSEDGKKLERADIRFYMGEINDVAAKNVKGVDKQTQDMMDNNFDQSDILGANGTHEGTHATDEQNIKDVKAKFDNPDLKTDTEKVPEAKEQQYINELIKVKAGGQ